MFSAPLKCFGFSVTLPSDFATIPSSRARPQPTPELLADFNISESAVTTDLAGTSGGVSAANVFGLPVRTNDRERRAIELERK